MKDPVSVVPHHLKDQDAPKYVQHHPSYREININSLLVFSRGNKSQSINLNSQLSSIP